MQNALKNLKFCKESGPFSYKKLKESKPVQLALHSLKERLNHPRLKGAPVFCLGNDAEWFVAQALLKKEQELRVGLKVPHPSAWWRRGGLYGRQARERLIKILKS